MRQEIPQSYIYWHCSECNDGGCIANWKGCCYDQTKFPRISDTEAPNPEVTTKITRKEMKALLSRGLYDAELGAD
jgi:hypothetical protein